MRQNSANLNILNAIILQRIKFFLTTKRIFVIGKNSQLVLMLVTKFTLSLRAITFMQTEK